MTSFVALIGHPLKRRHSEVMHNAAFEHFTIDARYQLYELEANEVPAFVAGTRAEAWLGFQVTAPHKLLVMEHIDVIERGAEEIGAVNSVLRRKDGHLVGFNTDAPGFQRGVETGLGIQLAGRRVAVAGAGGGARAVVNALVTAGAGPVTICDRTGSRADELAGQYTESVRAVALGDAFEKELRRVDLAVNATTMGMIEPGVAFDVSVLPDSASVFDLVYSPPESELLRRTRARGLPAANGLEMLVAQAEIAFERWTGIPDAGPIMREALVAAHL